MTNICVNRSDVKNIETHALKNGLYVDGICINKPLFQKIIEVRTMGSLNFRTYDQSKASRSSSGHDLDRGFAVEQVEKKLSAAKIRLVLEYQTFYKLLYS